MRWVADVKHNLYKIVILQMGERYLLQIEDGVLVQTFKFKIPEDVPRVSDIIEKIDEPFLHEIGLNFQKMKTARSKFLADFENRSDIFPEIL